MESIVSHHGIIGMHWGIRRFQRKDGTLTPAGRQRLENSKNKWLTSRSEKRKGFVDNDSDDLLVKSKKELYRVGGENETNTGSTYAVLRKDDYSKYASAGPEMEIYGNTKYTFVAKNEMKFAGAKAQMEAMIDVYGSMPQKEFVQKLAGTSNKGTWAYKNTKFKVDKIFEDRSNGANYYFDDVMLSMNQKYMARDNEIGKAVVQKLMDKGYSGARDFNDGTFSNTPLFVFNRSDLAEQGRKKINNAIAELDDLMIDEALVYDGR